MSNLSVVLSALAHLPSVTEAHGFLGMPEGREIKKWVEGKNFTPHGGIWNNTRDTDYTCGQYNDAPSNWKVTYDIKDSTFQTEIIFTANHGGNHHFNFVCMDGHLDKRTSEVPENEWEWLERADADKDDESFKKGYPHEFFVSKKPAGTKFQIGEKAKYISNTNTGKIFTGNLKAKATWKSPRGPCDHGILRWSWETNNSCTSDRFQTRGNQPNMSGLANWQKCRTGPKSTGMERYINCADVRVLVGGSAGQTPPPTTQTQAPPPPVITETQAPPPPVITETQAPTSVAPPATTQTQEPPPGRYQESYRCPNWESHCDINDAVADLCRITCATASRPQQPVASVTPRPQVLGGVGGGENSAANGFEDAHGGCNGWKDECGNHAVRFQCPKMCAAQAAQKLAQGRRRLDVRVDEDEVVAVNHTSADYPERLHTEKITNRLRHNGPKL